jgi:hypothetical protein
MTSFVAALEDAERAQLIRDLKAARDVLVTRGRCVGAFVVGERVCTLGAIGVATTEGFAQMDLEEQAAAIFCDRRPKWAEAALRAHLFAGPYGGEVFLFNDDLKTTDQDVLDLFDKTLADLGGLA